LPIFDLYNHCQSYEGSPAHIFKIYGSPAIIVSVAILSAGGPFFKIKAMKTLITVLLLIFWMQSASTQTSLAGKITDSATGEPILFAAVALYKSGVLIAGTETDFDGNYSFTEIDPGAYDVEVSYVGYEKQRIEGVSVLAGKINRLDIQMSTGITQ
jgi:hypothetical protein